MRIEGDGVIVNLQREKEKRGEVARIVSYRGKKEVSRNRYEVVSTMKGWQEAWEESYVRNGERVDLEKVGAIYISGGGAEQVKEG